MAAKKMKGVKSHARQRRDAIGMTQMEAAMYSGQSQATISRIEHGTITCSIESLWRYSAVLGLSPKDLYPMLAIRPKKVTHVLKRGAKDARGKKNQRVGKMHAGR